MARRRGCAQLVAAVAVLAMSACSGSSQQVSGAQPTKTASGRPTMRATAGTPSHSTKFSARPKPQLTGSALGSPTSESAGPKSQSQEQFLSGHFTYVETVTLVDREGKKHTGTGPWSLRAAPRRGSIQQISYYEGHESDNNTTTDQLRWGTDRRDLLSRVSRGPNCHWQPVVLDLRLPIKAGDSWSGRSGCYDQYGGRSTLVYQVRVGSPARKRVPGHGVQQIWSVHRVLNLTYTQPKMGTQPQFTLRVVTEEDTEYLPGLLIPLRQVDNTKTYQDNGQVSTDSRTRDLTSS